MHKVTEKEDLDSIMTDFNMAFEKGYSNPIVRLLRFLAEKVGYSTKNISSEETWIPFKELCKKYPFIAQGSMRDVMRHAPDNQVFYKQTGVREFLFHPKNLMIHIAANKKVYPKFYARIKRESFYGLWNE